MFLSDKNKELLLELIHGLPGEMPPEQIDALMKQFPTDDSIPLLETNKKFLMYYLQIVNDIETKKITPTIDSEVPKISIETLMMEMSFVKQELVEVKKMVLLLTQLIQQNSTVTQNTNRN